MECYITYSPCHLLLIYISVTRSYESLNPPVILIQAVRKTFLYHTMKTSISQVLSIMNDLKIKEVRARRTCVMREFTSLSGLSIYKLRKSHKRQLGVWKMLCSNNLRFVIFRSGCSNKKM